MSERVQYTAEKQICLEANFALIGQFLNNMFEKLSYYDLYSNIVLFKISASIVMRKYFCQDMCTFTIIVIIEVVS